MHAGEHHPGNDEDPHQFAGNGIEQFQEALDGAVEDAQRAGQMDASFILLHDDGDEFEIEDVEVEHDAHGHLEEDRIRVPVNQRLPDGPGAADVHQQAQDDEGVPQHGRQQRRAYHGLVVMAAQDVGDKGRGEPAGGQSDAGGHIDTDPQPPGAGVGEVGDITDAADVTGDDRHGAGGHQEGQQDHAGCPELGPQGAGGMAHGFSPSRSMWRSPLSRKPHMTPLNMPNRTMGDQR